MDDNIESIFIRELNQSFCDYNLNIIDIDENIDCQRMLDILDGRQVGQKHKPTIIDTNDYDKYKQNSIESKMVSPVKSSNNEKQYINLNISPVKLPVKNESSPLKERTNSEPISNKKVFQVIFGQYKPYRKKKEWSYDGFIMVKPEGTFLYNSSGRIIADTNENLPRKFSTGTTLIISKWECEIQQKLLVSEFESGAFFINEEEI